jgi:peptide/nickel transport system substrate-binding protein
MPVGTAAAPDDTMVLTRNANYRPRSQPMDFLAGDKKVSIRQLMLKVMPNDGTGAAARLAGEIGDMQFLPFACWTSWTPIPRCR